MKPTTPIFKTPVKLVRSHTQYGGEFNYGLQDADGRLIAIFLGRERSPGLDILPAKECAIWVANAINNQDKFYEVVDKNV